MTSIVENAGAVVNALFESGGTPDGWIIRRGDRFVVIRFRGRAYRINRWGVWFVLKRNPGPSMVAADFEHFWTGEDGHPTCSECRDIARSLATRTTMVPAGDSCEIAHWFR